MRYWKDKSICSGKLGLAGSIKDPVKDKEEAEINRLKELIGELTIANEAMKRSCEERKKIECDPIFEKIGRGQDSPESNADSDL